jgi:hypothetical protein
MLLFISNLFLKRYKKTDMIRILIFVAAVLIGQQVVTAQTVIWNYTALEHAKRVQPDAVKALVRGADKELNKTAPSVMDKTMTPDSGDKHDYMSMGRYWWPNPATPNGLPYIRKDGVSNPELSKLDRERLAAMSKSVVTLSLAYYFTGDEKYASKAVQIINTWFLDKATRMNPNLNYGQTIPGHTGGKGRGEGVLDGYSFVPVLDAVALLNSSGNFKQEEKEGLQKWFAEYLDWLLTSDIAIDERDAKNNHGLAYDVQAARVALFAGRRDVAEKIVAGFPAKRLFAQIEPDGRQPLELARTNALGYSVFNLTHMLDMCYLARALGTDLWKASSPDGRGIAKAIDYLARFAGKKADAFPYQQLKNWDKTQEDLLFEMFRADKLCNLAAYSKIYDHYYPDLKNDMNYVLYNH